MNILLTGNKQKAREAEQDATLQGVRCYREATALKLMFSKYNLGQTLCYLTFLRLMHGFVSQPTIATDRRSTLSQLYLPSPGILSSRSGLLSSLLVHLLVIFFIGGARLLAWGGVVGDLVGRPHVIYCTKLLSESSQVLRSKARNC